MSETEPVYLLAKKMAATSVGSVVTGWPTNYYFTMMSNYVDSCTSPITSAAPTTSDEYNTYMAQRAAAVTTAGQWTALTSTDTTSYPNGGTEAAGTAMGYGIRQGVLQSTYWDTNGRGSYWNSTAFATASGKLEFFYATNYLYQSLTLHVANHTKTMAQVMTAVKYTDTAARIAADGNDIVAMPHWESPKHADGGHPELYPFLFMDYKSKFGREGRTGNVPWHYEFKRCDGDVRNRDVIKINPLDAPAGVTNGDRVKVTSPWNPTGFVCHVKFSSNVPRGTALKAYGQGHWAYGRFAAGKLNFNGAPRPNTGNNNELMPAEWERIVGGNARNANTRVKIVWFADDTNQD
jgi:hypothetical protein